MSQKSSRSDAWRIRARSRRGVCQWNIVGNIENISQYLSRIIPSSRIEVIPEDKKNVYVEVEIGV